MYFRKFSSVHSYFYTYFIFLSSQLTCCIGNTVENCDEENTYKQYYFPSSDDDDSPYPLNKRQNTESLDEFFDEVQAPKKKKKIRATTVGRATKEGMTYISSNEDDGARATHLIKIEIIDLKKVANISTTDYWKHADVRVKYYVQPKQASTHHQQVRQLIYKMTKELSQSPKSNKYTFRDNKDLINN